LSISARPRLTGKVPVDELDDDDMQAILPTHSRRSRVAFSPRGANRRTVSPDRRKQLPWLTLRAVTQEL
jgi:hypothetical protein